MSSLVGSVRAFVPLHLASKAAQVMGASALPVAHCLTSRRITGGVPLAGFSSASTTGTSQTSSTQPVNKFVSRVSHLGPLSTAALSVGAALVALADPSRADMVALLGELTAAPALRKMREQMMSTEEGQQILKERPRIREGVNVDFAALLASPPETFGHVYASFMTKHGFSPDERHEATCIANIDGSGSDEAAELQYVLQRYREVHDMWHCLSDLPPTVVGEAAVKWLEMVQTGLPMASLAAMASPLRMSNRDREAYFRVLVPWASKVGRSCVPLMAVRYEQMFHLPMEEVRKRLRFEAAPKYTNDGS